MNKNFLPLKPDKKSSVWRRKVPHVNFSTLHPVLVPVLTFAGLLIITLFGYMLFTRNHVAATNSRVVIISHDHVEQTVPSHEQTVGSLLKKLNISLSSGDVVEPSVNTLIQQDDFRINVYRAVPVKVIDGDRSTFTFSAATTPRSIAKQTGATVYAEDTLDAAPTTNFLRDGAIGERVVIRRARSVSMNLYGTPLQLRTRSVTVRDLLDEKNIHIATGDSIEPTAETPITADLPITISRKGTKLATASQDIAMPVETINDPSLAYGTNAIRQQGSPGRQVTTYQVNLQNGNEVSRTVIQTVIVQQPVKQIVAVGVNLGGIKGDMALAGISPSDYTYADYIISNESGWCPTKWPGEYGGCPPYHGAPGSGVGYGLCQATPGSKMSSAGVDWATNPVTQLKWCSGYATSRYGSWYAA